MENFVEGSSPGSFEARYVAFLETITHLRPRLHRYCARMTGSALDGEDIVQDALFRAYRKLDTFDDSRPLEPWLFGIAHNQCIDFLRHREVRQTAEATAVTPDLVHPVEPIEPTVNRAVEYVVLALPPKERACVLLKDVFDYSLEEVADLVGSTAGAVKAALNRGRSKLAMTPQAARAPSDANPAVSHLLHLYVERFNRRDWDSLRELIAADARLLVADRFAGPLAKAPYFARYERASSPWRMTVGSAEGEMVVVALQDTGCGWHPFAVIRVEMVTGVVVHIADYSHCPWVLREISSLTFESAPAA